MRDNDQHVIDFFNLSAHGIRAFFGHDDDDVVDVDVDGKKPRCYTCDRMDDIADELPHTCRH